MIFVGHVHALFPTAALIFGLTYVSDKYLLLNYHQISKFFEDKYHMDSYRIYIPAAAALYIGGSIWQFAVFNRQMQFYHKGASATWSYGTLYYILLVILISARNCFECCYCLKQSLPKLLRKEVQPLEHIPCAQYLREIPIRKLKGYYLRLLKQVKHHSNIKDKVSSGADKKVNFRYIKLLHDRLMDVKMIVHEYGIVLASWLEFRQVLLARKAQPAEEPEFRLDQTAKEIGQNQVAEVDIDKVENLYQLKMEHLLEFKELQNRILQQGVEAMPAAVEMAHEAVLANLLLLEKNSAIIYDFYSLIPTDDAKSAFRCSSLYKSYRIEENEDFAEAMQTFQ